MIREDEDMAEDKAKAKPETIKSPKKISNKGYIIGAAIAGILAGAAGVYVMESPSGNLFGQIVSSASPNNDSQEAALCLAKADKFASINDVAIGAVAAMQAAEKPATLSSLSFNAPDGSAQTLADHKGKILLVNLWATWCAPCREEMPALNQLQKDKGSDQFEVIALNIDTGDIAKPVNFLNEIGVEKLKLYRDTSMNSFNDLKRKGLAFGLPVTLLVDDEGCQIAAMNGPAAWDSEDAYRLIDAAIALGNSDKT